MGDTRFRSEDAPEWLPAEDGPAFRAQREIYLHGAAEMRERAAKLAEDRAERMGGISDMARQLEGFAKQIRALPLETEEADQPTRN